MAKTVFSDRAIDSLRDLSLDDMNAMREACTETVFRRVKHNITENDRVAQTVRALQAGDAATVGECLYASHASLRDDYEVSCAELDMLVDILTGVKGVMGARLTGAGFGGCIIAFVKEEALESVEVAVAKRYRPDSLLEGERAGIWPISISDGAHLMEQG